MGNIFSSLPSSTYVGWALIIGISGYAITVTYVQPYLRNKSNNDKRRKGPDRQVSQPKKENKAKRQRMESFANESKQTQPKSSASAASTSQAQTNGYSSDDGVDNRAFAQQMAQAQNKNKKVAPKAKTEQKKKSIKQSKAKELNEGSPEVGKVSAPSSTAGIDADDDQSPVASPSVSAADPSGVSDMLEQPTQGPSVLRLTDTAEKKQENIRQSKSPQPTETKKQRQNRKKREQEKALREEEEKDRKVKLEAQRRTAREAEGRAAKDGTAFMAAQKASAWGSNVTNGTVGQKAEPIAVQPLDTFDNVAKTVNTKSNAATRSANTNGKEIKQNGKKIDWADMPFSEEEQLAMIQKQAEEDEWVPVKSRKNKKASAGGPSETDESASETAPPATTKPAQKTKTAATNGRPKPQSMPTQSSFAALSDDGAALEDEPQEQEWDI